MTERNRGITRPSDPEPLKKKPRPYRSIGQDKKAQKIRTAIGGTNKFRSEKVRGQVTLIARVQDTGPSSKVSLEASAEYP